MELTQENFDALQGKLDESISKLTDSKEKINEFRDTNVTLLKKQEELEAKFNGIDLDAYQDMVKQSQDLKDKKMMSEGKLEELIEERTKAMIKAHGIDMDKLSGENAVLNSQLAGLVIDSAVRDSAIKAGVADTAVEDVLLRSKAVFTLKDGQAIPHDAQGNVIYGSASAEPMTVEEWVKGQQDSAPHLFKSSQGAGSEHGKSFNGKNSKDLTALEKLQHGFAK